VLVEEAQPTHHGKIKWKWTRFVIKILRRVNGREWECGWEEDRIGSTNFINRQNGPEKE